MVQWVEDFVLSFAVYFIFCRARSHLLGVPPTASKAAVGPTPKDISCGMPRRCSSWHTALQMCRMGALILDVAACHLWKMLLLSHESYESAITVNFCNSLLNFQDPVVTCLTFNHLPWPTHTLIHNSMEATLRRNCRKNRNGCKFNTNWRGFQCQDLRRKVNWPLAILHCPLLLRQFLLGLQNSISKPKQQGQHNFCHPSVIDSLVCLSCAIRNNKPQSWQNVDCLHHMTASGHMPHMPLSFQNIDNLRLFDLLFSWEASCSAKACLGVAKERRRSLQQSWHRTPYLLRILIHSVPALGSKLARHWWSGHLAEMQKLPWLKPRRQSILSIFINSITSNYV